MAKKSPQEAAEEILRLRDEGSTDDQIREAHPELNEGFAYLAQQAGGDEASPGPASPTSLKTAERRHVPSPFS